MENVLKYSPISSVRREYTGSLFPGTALVAYARDAAS